MTMQPAYDAIRAAGFEVYAPFRNGRESTYAFFTDGVHVGYIQRGDYGYGYRLSTVHCANRQTGTGFSLTDSDKALDASELTPETLATAFSYAPHWASAQMRNSVRKYANWDAFKASYWDRALERVSA